MPDNAKIEAQPVGNVQDSLELLNRTKVMINDDADDPLNINSPAAEQEPVEEAVVPEDSEKSEQPAEEKVDEQSTTEDKDKPANVDKEAFLNNLNDALKESTGVDLTGITEALVELLTWRNDILSLELQQQQPKQQQQSNRQIPAAVRPGGREGIQARNYEFRQSEIDAMDSATYQKNRQAITEAYLNGRVLKDK